MTADFAPRGLAPTVAVVVIALEAAVFGLAAIAYVALGVVGDGSGVGVSYGLAALGALVAVGLVFLAKGLSQGRRWAVSPAITWHVLQGFAGAYFLSIGQYAYGAACLALALAALVPLIAIARGLGSRG